MVKEEIEKRLQAKFSPHFLEVVDQSAHHAGHAGAIRDDGGEGETHFKVKIRATYFDQMNRIAAQREIYRILSDLMDNPIHALALDVSS